MSFKFWAAQYCNLSLAALLPLKCPEPPVGQVEPKMPNWSHSLSWQLSVLAGVGGGAGLNRIQNDGLESSGVKPNSLRGSRQWSELAAFSRVSSFAPHGTSPAPPSDEDDHHYDSATLGDCILTTAEHRLLKTKFANSFRQFRGSLVEFELSSLSE